MSYHSRSVLPPGLSRKRKERDAFYPVMKPSAPTQLAAAKPNPKADQEPVSSNRLLAGYLAYEYLTKGTLFGEKYDPGRAEAVPLAGGSVESKGGKGEGEPPGEKKEHKGYAAVASIMKTDGTHIPGIVNPSELARWIKM